ncbi:MAG: SMI1/KNR4 family protein [Bacteroidota bacterium]
MEIIINELRKFSDDILELGNNINDNRIEEFEQHCNLTISPDFKQFMKKVNGFSLMGTEVYGFDKDKVNAIENIYYREHFEVRSPQYPYLVPFSPDGRGNFYCLDTLNQLENGDFPIIFWVSNYEYTKEDVPEITHNNFLDWVQEIVIDWILEDYNYDGSEK